tara:strand:+ start:345 stop:707 length:363 start_codon:yes stop_codon:yes gene_type:complete
MSFSNTIIVGNLGRDPELKSTSGGMAIASFSVAVTIRKETHWYNCKAFGKTAEFVTKYLVKGRCVCVSGEMKSSKWEDKEGNKRISWELSANNVQAVGPKEASTSNQTVSSSADDAEIPF